MSQANKTKVKRILEYIRDNSPARATDICKACLEPRPMPAPYGTSGRPYTYYPGWSGFRVYLAQNWGWSHDPKKALIKSTKKGYILTKLGRKRLA